MTLIFCIPTFSPITPSIYSVNYYRKEPKSVTSFNYERRMAFAIPSFTRWLCCFKVSFQMRQQRTNNQCCKKCENIFGGFTDKAWTSKINWYDSKVQIGFNELVTTDEWLRTCLFNFKACRKACVTVILALITFVNFLLIFKLLFPLYSESLHTPHTCAICVR